MKEINLVTCNENKIDEYKCLLEPEFKVNVLKIDYPELRSDNISEIASLAAKQLAENLGKTVVLEDGGFFIDALKDFPGICSAYIFKRIKNKGILQLMKGIKNRKCLYKVAIAYCKPGKQPKIFLGGEEGTIAMEIKGDNGWGYDPIFIPDGKNKTYGEIRNKGDINLFRKRAIEKLVEFLRKR
ncbi:RdgB/HAM1 family non-canonical purine NTP pyrophosphatase [Candidatus Woesearchaeota archaeon]|nr:RdgB/HAM1 family non-canonical purine NTP pyrophosphatase [Candidatus Woesearchaeota archaeon]